MYVLIKPLTADAIFAQIISYKFSIPLNTIPPCESLGAFIVCCFFHNVFAIIEGITPCYMT